MCCGRAWSEAASNGASRAPYSHITALQQARRSKFLYRVRRQCRFRFALENPASYGKTNSHIHQVESLHNSPFSRPPRG